jgi:hypothetical protein
VSEPLARTNGVSEPHERSGDRSGPRERVRGVWRGEAPRLKMQADVAQLAERVLGKDEVTSSILVIGSNLRSLREPRLASQRARFRRVSSDARSGNENR